MPIFKSQTLSKLKMPVFMIFGDSDQLIPAEKSIKYLKQYVQQAEIELLADTGHLIIGQTERILEFLNKKWAAIIDNE